MRATDSKLHIIQYYYSSTYLNRTVLNFRINDYFGRFANISGYIKHVGNCRCSVLRKLNVLPNNKRTI